MNRRIALLALWMLALAALPTARRQPGPRSEVFFSGPSLQVGPGLCQELQQEVVTYSSDGCYIPPCADSHQHLVQLFDLGSVLARGFAFGWGLA